jgi:hypothetical protein
MGRGNSREGGGAPVQFRELLFNERGEDAEVNVASREVPGIVVPRKHLSAAGREG